MTDDKELVPTTIRLDRETIIKISRIAKTQERTPSWVMRTAIRDWIARQETKTNDHE